MFKNLKLDYKTKMIYPITTLVTLVFFTLICSSPAIADTLNSPAFQIQMSTVNLTGGNKSSASYKLSDTVGQTFQGQFNSAGYVIQAGFQYINTLIPFSFRISNLSINFGSLVPGTPSTLSNILTITTGSAFGYTVKAIEDHPLSRSDGLANIPDTACDLGTTCLQTSANIWADNARYGFGYNMSGADITGDFVNSTYYRPFPAQNVDQPAIIMSKNGIATSSAATVTYKINIAGGQAAGTYQNAIQYIAIPAF